MVEYETLVAEEITATLDRAGFGELSTDIIHIDVTGTFQRKLGECRIVQTPDGEADQYRIRIAQRLFEADIDPSWQDTVRHEVAHAYVYSRYGRDVQPHGTEWKEAATQAGADPKARYEGDDLIDADYMFACPTGCFERGYFKRSKRIKHPWKYSCKECNTRLVSYDAGECPASIEPGTCYVASIPWERAGDQTKVRTSETAAYILGCPNGCTEWPYQQRAKRIKNPWQYTCPDCKSTLVSCDGKDSPTAFTPGTCNVESIPWTEPQIISACPNGCFTSGYAQHCKQTRYPDKYWCEECNTQTISCPVNQQPDDPIPGTNYTDSTAE